MDPINVARWEMFKALATLGETSQIDRSTSRDEALSVILEDLAHLSEPSYELLARRFSSLCRNRLRKVYERRSLAEGTVVSDRRHNGQPIHLPASHDHARELLARVLNLEVIDQVRQLIGDGGLQDFQDIADGRTYEDIAIRSHSSLSATKSRIFRNRQLARVMIGGACNSEAA